MAGCEEQRDENIWEGRARGRVERASCKIAEAAGNCSSAGDSKVQHTFQTKHGQITFTFLVYFSF